MAFPTSMFAEDETPKAGIFMSGLVPHLKIQIPPAGVRTLRNYHQEFGQPKQERIEARATVLEGNVCYTDVAIHLKGSYTYRDFDDHPSLTLHFDKHNPGQRFHGQNKIHLNNSIQDDSYLCEQLGRELFVAAGVPSPAAGHATVEINGRKLGLYVVIEGANKTFLRQYFNSVKGNLYERESGRDVTSSELKARVGENPDDRSDQAGLLAALRIGDPRTRLLALDKVLDLDRFISYAAAEDFVVHWDGYCGSCNNYNVYHDTDRDKMVFIPHGMDQLFGRSRPIDYSILPPLRGAVARGVLSTPEGRQRYLNRLRSLSTDEFREEAIQARLDALAIPVRAALETDPEARARFDSALRNLKRRVSQRVASVAAQLGIEPVRVTIDPAHGAKLKDWNFHSSVSQPSTGVRQTLFDQEVLKVVGNGARSSGSWRVKLLLGPGQYEFTGSGRAAVEDPAGATPAGVLLRMSGERSTGGIFAGRDWTQITYRFELQAEQEVELVCEFRGAGAGFFDLATLQLRQKEP